MPEKLTAAEQYDLREQEHRFRQEKEEKDLSYRLREKRINAWKELCGWVAFSVPATAAVICVFLYNNGPDEGAERENRKEIVQLENAKELQLACIEAGGIWTDTCIWSKGDEPNG